MNFRRSLFLKVVFFMDLVNIKPLHIIAFAITVLSTTGAKLLTKMANIK